MKEQKRLNLFLRRKQSEEYLIAKGLHRKRMKTVSISA